VAARAPAEDMPRFVAPMLADSRPLPADEEGWTAEVKWDGCRLQVRLDGRRLCLRTRSGRVGTGEFPELERLSEALGRRRVILDAELVCFDSQGRPDFSRLRSRLGRHGPDSSRPVTVMILDILHLDGRAVRELRYAERRSLLENLELEGSHWRTPQSFPRQVDELVKATAAHGLEGVVVKRLASRYQPGRRSSAWRKHKHRRREQMLVTGWLPADRGRREAFAVSRVHLDGTLRHAGTVSFGLSPAEREELRDVLRLASVGARRRGSTWLTVEPVARVVVDSHGRPDGPIRDPVIRGAVLTRPGG
jgi:bifunctional non-homologous end joining protein LigD